MTIPMKRRIFFLENNPLIFQLFNRKRTIKESVTEKMMANKSISFQGITSHSYIKIITSKQTSL
jgi:hypothetical protein